MEALGKLLMLVAGGLFALGLLVFLLGRSGGGFLPGDIVIRKGDFTLFVPIATSIVLSVLLTVVLWFLTRR